MQQYNFTTKVGDREITIETGTLARLANAAVTVRTGDSVMLVTACATTKPREGIDFFPLSVDYEERLYAAGRIPGSFFRREGRPSEGAILLSRLVDRPLRPLFPAGMRNDVQITLTALASDPEYPLDILGIIGASAALTISDIPWDGPVGAVRVGLVDGEFVINPTTSQMARSSLDLRLAGTADAILMVEAGADEVPEDVMLQALRLGHEAMQPIIALQDQMRQQLGKPKFEFTPYLPDAGLQAAASSWLGDRVREIIAQSLPKAEQYAALDALQAEMIAALGETYDPKMLPQAFDHVLKEVVRERILSQGIRPDGRGYKEIRPITAEVGVLPRVHGSGLFTRGETQVLTIATLGTPREAQTLDTLNPEDELKRYMHHYNFPPYSTGEVAPMRGPKRREIGHGALAERALEPMIPATETFPYTLRLVSEVLASNGSTSMASVCGSTLALMDAGVPIKAPVAGIAMGLVTDGEVGRADLRYAVLSDIQGMEDHLGDMDFKVAGTERGITALQMDIKIRGLSYQIMEEALAQAREGRLHILAEMAKVLQQPREKMSEWAPSIITLRIDPEKIRDVIGKGGAVIRQITEETGTTIDIENDGTVKIASVVGAAGREAQRRIELITADVEVGRIYEGKVAKLMDFGAFVTILPGRDGLVHISQISEERVERVSDKLKEGDVIRVKVLEVDRQGRVRLSMRDIGAV